MDLVLALGIFGHLSTIHLDGNVGARPASSRPGGRRSPSCTSRAGARPSGSPVPGHGEPEMLQRRSFTLGCGGAAVAAAALAGPSTAWAQRPAQPIARPP